MIEGWEQTLGPGPLLAIVGAAVVVLLFMIIKLKVHPFIALVLVSLFTAIATRVPPDQLLDVLSAGFGSTLADVALLVGIGAMLGRLVEVSGGALVLANSLIKAFGEHRAPLGLGVAALVLSFPIFFDAAFIVFLPVILTTARRLGGSLLLYALPAVGAMSAMHVFVPPHPGPVSASTFYGANVGIVMLIGIPVAVVTWYLAPYLLGVWMGKRVNIPVPDLFGRASEKAEENPPRFSTLVAILLLPMILIGIETTLSTLNTAGVISDGQTDSFWYGALSIIGTTPVALIITLLVATVTIGLRGRDLSNLEELLDQALGPVCSVILVTGAGGMFGGVLKASGIGDALSGALDQLGAPVIVAAFLVALTLRVAQGSATAALVTTGGLLSAAVMAADYNEIQLAAIVIATAAGSEALSHVNDSGFWLVSRMFNMSVKTTLKTYTVITAATGTVAFLIALGLFAVGSMV